MTTNTRMKKCHLMNRRSLLRLGQGIGISAGLWPLLRSLPSFAQQQTATPRGNKRFMVVWHPHGMHQPSWTCGTGHRADADWQLSRVLDPLEPVKGKTNVVEGITGVFNEGGERHQRGMVGLLNGAEMFKESPSIDQVLADHWETKVLNLGAQAEPRLHNRKSRYENFRISFRGPGADGAQDPNNNPFSAFEQVFSGFTGQPAGPQSPQRVLLASNRSVLDAIKAEVDYLRPRIALDDLRLLDAHQQSIREVECRLHGVACERGMMPEVVQAGSCEAPQLMDQPNQLDNFLRENDSYPVIAKMQADIAKTASACGLAPVSLVQFAATESRQSYGWVTNEDGQPATSGNHHGMSHNIYSNDRSAKDFNAIHRYYSQHVADIATYLDSIPEGNGTALDNTLIYWGTCLGNPSAHYQSNWPSVLVGNVDGFFKTNQSLDFRRPNSNCYTRPGNCHSGAPSDHTQTDLLNTMAAGLGLGATNDTPVIGNFEHRNLNNHVSKAFNGLLPQLLA